MKKYKVIITNESSTIIQADDFCVDADSHVVKFRKFEDSSKHIMNVCATFSINNIIGVIELD